MNISVQIRRYGPGEERALFEVYYSAIHLTASRDYTAEQIQAWAPKDLDMNLWAKRIRGINPFVAEMNGEVVGYTRSTGERLRRSLLRVWYPFPQRHRIAVDGASSRRGEGTRVV
jgi:hypothetical protein